MKKIPILFLLALSVAFVYGQQTEKVYLSGKDFKNPVQWEFMCTNGNNANTWTTIDVPSHWELKGFGEYTYGRWYKELDQDEPSKEEGFYKYQFTVPQTYKDQQVKIFFGGAMTDTEVKINGKLAGEVHQGGFYEFSYDITDLIVDGENLLEVHVKKHSDNHSVNRAERWADWWLFGGIYRPVWLEIKPKTHIENIFIDAKMDGEMEVVMQGQNIPNNTYVNASIQKLGESDSKHENQKQNVSGEEATLSFKWNNVDPWSPEMPNLYTLSLQLKKGNEILHEVEERFGFRTLEFKKKDGIYVNGKKIIMKGINRHTIWPESGRSTDKEISIMDANLIKDMNMNAVRVHYPPDDHFLEVCDSLGLFVLDELAGWQNPYDIETGTKLIKEVVTRDVNHPSVIIWDQGNEGGWRDELDSVFYELDPQQRIVIHPWADYNGWDTHHYPMYLTGVHRFVDGENVFFPTEFMHGTYDNGHGSGLEDFWNRFKESPLFAGGFMWAFSDEAVLRTDWDGERKYDSKGSLAPDGILGPHREKEGSFYTVKDVWSPIQLKPIRITPSFDGSFLITNEYIYTNLDACTMKYEVKSMDKNAFYGDNEVAVIAEGTINLPAIEPRETRKVKMDLPSLFFEGDWLEITAHDQHGRLVNVWTWPIHQPDYYAQKLLLKGKTKKASVKEKNDVVELEANSIKIQIGKKDGILKSVYRGRVEVPFNEGPYPLGMKAEVKEVITSKEDGKAVCVVRYTGGIDHIKWTMHPDGRLKMEMVALKNRGRSSGFDGAFYEGEIKEFGITFNYPEEGVEGMEWFGRGPYRVWKNRIKGTNYGLWQKDYNNTITGESFENLVYPEFKGYHANLIGAKIDAGNNTFRVFSESENVFLRLLTPDKPKYALKGARAYPEFPFGDISFMYEIPAMHSFKPVPHHGPHSQPSNIRIKSGDDGIPMNLWFDFRDGE
ncbi:beta-galactosidase [Galbibacter sp. EGI 63066]|uniref:glycoside hydrolase family 2 TIM barrel-domain containing protein n=1 Tax=Galbibacter sp. EGI 63066 TaxID=2993559 RepID=UPI0022498832|nr:glycoside hydrolase family 2 TIM barrel-domain containing protein [Galbibacter sp. EGI 63066]MCX2678596.1 beta-galactosidase [Galbibacter sp. EGI 63066]